MEEGINMMIMIMTRR